ncbi:hypothetical protein [Staphylococcus aureus]
MPTTFGGEPKKYVFMFNRVTLN